MKIKAKVKEERLMTMVGQGILATVDANKLVSVDGFIPIVSATELDENTLEVVTAVIDENLNIIVPFRKKVVNKKDFEETFYDNAVTVYNNKKAIYQVGKREIYVIDLNNVSFEKRGDEIVPVNPVLKMKTFGFIDQEKIAAFQAKETFIYNVVKDEKVGESYYLISHNPGEKTYYGIYKTDENKNAKPFIMEFQIDPNSGKACDDKVLLNREIVITLPKRIIGNKQKTIRFCDACYNKYVEALEDNGIGKILQ